MDLAVSTLRRWTRAEYERLVAQGFFGPDERLELLDGEIVTMTPQLSAHATAVRKTTRALERVFAQGYDVRPQLPLALGAYSEPEPDVAVVPGEPDDYARAHPTSALLVVEVAESSLRLDRQRKGPIYAAAGIAEYWIVNLEDRRLEVYREPVHRPDGVEYRLIQRLSLDESLSPLAAPTAIVAVDTLFPSF